MTNHILGNGCLRKVDSEFQQFSVDSGRSPKGVRQTHLSDQIPHFRRNHPAPDRRTSAFPGPVETKSFAMPTDNCFRINDCQCRTPTCPEAGQPDQKKRSPEFKRRRFLLRCSTVIWWRRAIFSACRAARLRRHDRKTRIRAKKRGFHGVTE